MRRYFKLKHSIKYNNKIIPGLDGKSVNDKDLLFGTSLVGANKFFKSKVKFDYFILTNFGELESNEAPLIICDYHQWVGEYPIGGQFLPISETFRKLLLRFELPEHRFYPTKVLFEGTKYKFSILQVLMNTYIEFIDFQNTRFNNLNLYGELLFEKKDIKTFNNFEEMEEYYLINWDFNWNYEKIVMKTIFRDIDLIYLPQLNEVVSERLKIAIEEAGITGVEFEELPIPIEFSDEV
jgi:hypothetical protein